MKILIRFLIQLTLVLSILKQGNAVTMQQFEQSLDMMRNGCAPKFKVSTEQLNDLRTGKFPPTDDNKELMCYMKCIAQMSGVMTKKGEFSVQKAVAQMPYVLPEELFETATTAMETCAPVQKNYKDPCERVYFISKCAADFNPKGFRFP